jgi:hypothetical protein
MGSKDIRKCWFRSTRKWTLKLDQICKPRLCLLQNLLSGGISNHSLTSRSLILNILTWFPNTLRPSFPDSCPCPSNDWGSFLDLLPLFWSRVWTVFYETIWILWKKLFVEEGENRQIYFQIFAFNHEPKMLVCINFLKKHLAYISLRVTWTKMVTIKRLRYVRICKYIPHTINLLFRIWGFHSGGYDTASYPRKLYFSNLLLMSR